MGTIVFYTFVFSLLFYLSWRGEKYGKKKTILFAYIILYLLSILRYDVGNDYEGYCNAISEVLNMFDKSYSSLSDMWIEYTFWTKGASEPSLMVFCYIFKSFPYPFFWVIACYYTFALIFLYKTLDYYDCHKLGLVMFFVSGLMFWYWDMIRQCVAISFIFYATTYIKEGKIWKYLLMVLFGMFFHLSMLFTLPLYFFRYVRLSKWIYVFAIILSIGMLFSGFTFEKFFSMVENIPFYGDYGSDPRLNATFDSFGYKIRMAFHGVVTIYTLMCLPKKYEYLMVILTFGTVLFVLASGNMIIQRVALYPYYVVIFAFPLAIKQLPRTAMLSVGFLILVFYLLSVKNMVDGSDRGCSPYNTVFSEDFVKGKFKYRDYN